MHDLMPSAFEVLFLGMLIPYVTWCVASIYSLRQAVAVIAKDIERTDDQHKQMFDLLKNRLK